MAKKPSLTKFKRNIFRPEESSDGVHTSVFFFVGSYLSRFYKIESYLDLLVMTYFMTAPTDDMTAERRKSIIEKNSGIIQIFEHSLLGTEKFSFQLKVEMVRAGMQKSHPAFYVKYGEKILSLVSRLQKLRNTIAHFRTYDLNGIMYLSKPRFTAPELKKRDLKGGNAEDILKEYEGYYVKEAITIETLEEIFEQLSTAEKALLLYFTEREVYPPKKFKKNEIRLETNFKTLDLGKKKGAYNLEIINF